MKENEVIPLIMLMKAWTHLMNSPKDSNRFVEREITDWVAEALLASFDDSIIYRRDEDLSSDHPLK